MSDKQVSISGHDIKSQAYKDAMENANRGYYSDATTFPLRIRNNKDVKQALYLLKLDEQYKRKAK